MKKMILMILSLLALIISGCEDNNNISGNPVDNTPPAIPQGVYSITGDGFVFIEWLPVQDADLKLYKIWWSADDSLFELMSTTENNYYIDTDVDNGTTYYYAVSSVDNDNNESDLSRESVYDTPRPEGFDIILTDYHDYPEDAGFDLAAHVTVPYGHNNADIYLEYSDVDEVFYFRTANGLTDIQDVGYMLDTTDFFSELNYAPDEGWSATGKVEVIMGHVYVIWTDDNHFAKIRPYDTFDNIGVKIAWAYQTDPGNPELAPIEPAVTGEVINNKSE